jgi:hypothetical protein
MWLVWEIIVSDVAVVVKLGLADVKVDATFAVVEGNTPAIAVTVGSSKLNRAKLLLVQQPALC